MKTMTTEDLCHKLESGPVALFDVRGDVEFEKGHIPGAKTAPLGSLVFRVASLMKPESLVVVYARDQSDGLAVEAAERLEGLRMRNVYTYTDGLEGWQAAGHKVTPSVSAKLHTQGPVEDCRHVVVDRENAYGGAFKGDPSDVAGAGG